ncbi:mannose-1-phosphate guanylyltransferase [Paenibacillus sp. Soil750]|uniref:mannose-1-phosphate guanylyltransferase n=1 Tax=Paenibacillus sp. Soil750 TaxID=1736398 RepID=UPI0006F95A8E|nr:mannose-1-phosphate guanylyltransferase [Paenibacillus sp. Soil750]KRE75409.1 mannose-1-phosphate guanylyltransferase [Paenibacillus sp. Soil750]
MELVAVILAGGKGERFWPKSRTKLPKQFLNISGNKTMIQQVIERLKLILDVTHIFVVTNELYAELIKVQVPDLPKENIIIEPIGKNTAPCIGLASIIIERKYPNTTMIVLPSDHIITDEKGFIQILETAANVANKSEHVVTLGINPTYPETGYGYIEAASDSFVKNSMKVLSVKKFTEKPEKEQAEKYLIAGNFYWNSGIFVWKTSVIRNLIAQYLPEIHDILETIKTSLDKQDFIETIRTEFAKMPDQSIDYGIMEKAKDIYVIPCSFGWDDVGSWNALERINELDQSGNFISGNTLTVDTKGCIIESGPKLIATLGIEDLIIINTDDVTLICTKDRAQEVKLLLKELRDKKLEKYL